MVRDDGKGFDPAERSAGFGLLGMRERLALVRGTLEIESTPGAGTTMRATVPAGATRRRAHGDDFTRRRGLGGEERASGASAPRGTMITGQWTRAHQPAADAADEHGAQRAVAARAREHQVEAGAALAELVGRVAGEPDALGLDVARAGRR